MSNIQRTEQYLKQKFNQSEYLKINTKEYLYRLDHTMRVRYWGQYIAQRSDLNEEALVVGCLLHDISYVEEMKNGSAHVNHGRRSAEICEQFVKSLDFSTDVKNDILYGIQIHVDGKPNKNMNWHNSTFAESISDADNLDRYDVYRIYDSLQYDKFSDKLNSDKIKYYQDQILRIRKNKSASLATTTATNEFHKELNFSEKFYERMLEQMQRTL
jgi:uncharacterized protein